MIQRLTVERAQHSDKLASTAQKITEHAQSMQAQRMQATQQRMGNMFTPNQVLGRLQTIGCVAVEITQKCNLDCTLCYLSEHSQQVADVPIEEIFRRLDDVLKHYGPGTHVQITGGDPTLRKHSELIEIVRYANDLGLYTALFTNGISATRKLLTQLSEVGLRDVAFHVDSTQRRDGGDSESSLNDVREQYLRRAEGLGLMVIFNTTVHKDNFHEIPDLVEFFRGHADQIGLASFQLQADTGRGEWRKRAVVINRDTVQQQVEQGSSKNLPWEALQVGHRECHSYLPTVVVNKNLYALVPDAEFFADFVADFGHISWDRQQALGTLLWGFAKALARKPSWWWRLLKHGIKLGTPMLPDLLKAGGKIHKLTFFVQNFMDANELDQARVDACSFMVMTDQGPVSMCQHNAQRDDFILRPLDIKRADGSAIRYQPLKTSKANKRLEQIAVQSH
ncbi:MAG: radical SAM protein [Acidiferrobacterales bacterium]|nr:radical SAM protein [Acidiferrobacterales bacterium]